MCLQATTYDQVLVPDIASEQSTLVQQVILGSISLTRPESQSPSTTHRNRDASDLWSRGSDVQLQYPLLRRIIFCKADYRCRQLDNAAEGLLCCSYTKHTVHRMIEIRLSTLGVYATRFDACFAVTDVHCQTTTVTQHLAAMRSIPTRMQLREAQKKRVPIHLDRKSVV